MPLSQTKLKKVEKAIARKQRTFTGEELGFSLVDYLERKDRPPDDPVEGLIGLFEFPTNPHAIREFSEEAVRKRKHLRLQTARVLEVTTEGTVAVKEVPIYAHDAPLQQPEAEVLRYWNKCYALIGRGLLDRVRRCAKGDCRKWFYARFRHAVFHDEECRLAVESANPEYKERRREHMRKIREQARKGGKKS
jgi:hypothetical protein